MTVHPERRLLGIMVAAVITYVAGMNALLVWLYAVTAMLLALIPVGIVGPLIALAGMRRLDVTGVTREGFDAPLRQDAGRTFMGDTVAIGVRPAPRADRLDIAAVRTEDGRTIAAGLSDEERDAQLVVTLDTRGPCVITSATVTSSWPFGLLTVRRQVPVTVALLAHPRYTIVDAERGTGTGVGDEDPSRKGQADDVVGLREYRPGDSRRQVHWMTTARTGQLTVVERAAPTFAALQARLRLDPGAGAAACDLAIFITATLVASCTRAGRPFRLTLPDGPPEARRWSDAVARLARARPEPARLGRGVSAAIAATAAGVTVETGEGVVHLATDASVDDVRRVVATLL